MQLKLSWCDPQVLERTLPEIKAMVVVPGAHQAPAETSFLETITAKPTEGADNLAAPHDPAIERHHRHTMLAYLVTTQSEHADRKRWLEELSTSGPPQQRAWAAQWLRAASSGQSDQEPPPDAGRGTVRQKK